MRKITMLLSTLALISMLLVACGGEGTATTAPATEFPTLEEPTVDLTPELPDGTETGVPTGEGTPDDGIPVTGEEDPSRLSNQLDYDVWNQNGEQIGEVNDMVLDLDNTMVSYVIVGTGGFLEIGERDILVPWDQLMLQTEGGDMTGGEQFAFILQADQQLFENAPDFDVNTGIPGRGLPAGDWDADLRNYWEGGVVPAGTPATGGTPDAGAAGTPGTGQAGTGTPDAGTGVTGTPDAGTGMTATPGAAGTMDPNATALPGTGGTLDGELQGVVLASELLGTNVNIGAGGTVTPGTVLGTGTPDATNDNGNANGNANDAQGTGTPDATNNNGNTNGNANDAQGTPGAGTGTGIQDGVTNATVDDVLVDVDSGDILYVVLTAGFPDGERLIPVPMSQFNWNTTNDGTLFLNVDQVMFSTAPFFQDGEYPSSMEEGWDDEFSVYWQ